MDAQRCCLDIGRVDHGEDEGTEGSGIASEQLSGAVISDEM